MLVNTSSGLIGIGGIAKREVSRLFDVASTMSMGMKAAIDFQVKGFEGDSALLIPQLRGESK